MKGGIIAAGHGTRLSSGKTGVVKPLVPIAGTPLCHWVAGSLSRAGLRELTVVHNSAGRAVRESLTRAFPDLSWSFLERDTASSWETFRLLSLALAAEGEPFLISTVDALIAPASVRAFAARARELSADAALALTDFIDDEKPLWADLDPATGLVTALGADARGRALATAGLYYLTPAAVRLMPEASRFGALREYLGALARSGARLAGARVDKAVDVDRPEDVKAAEAFLKEAAASW